MSIIVSAPGKIHLLGEHAVVYGYPALLTAVGKRLYVEIKPPKKEKKSLGRGKDDGLIKSAISVFQKEFNLNKLPPFTISVTSDIPSGSGMGSSAALSAATIGALMRFVKNIWNPVKINEIAYKIEKITHGNPSGADNTVVVFGGLLWYRKEFDFLKSIWSLPISQYKIPRFVFGDTGKPVEDTKEMVAKVGEQFQKKTKKMREIFFDQERQTKNLLLALKSGEIDRMSQAIKAGERNLEKMGVVSADAKKIVREIEHIGGVAKICGGGGWKKGSGIVLCFHRDFGKLKKVIEKANLTYFETALGEEGIRIERNC